MVISVNLFILHVRVRDKARDIEREREREREINNCMTVNNIITGMEREFNCIIIIFFL